MPLVIHLNCFSTCYFYRWFIHGNGKTGASARLLRASLAHLHRPASQALLVYSEDSPVVASGRRLQALRVEPVDEAT